MKPVEFEFGISKVSTLGPCYVIAEIGHNHQGNLDTAFKLIAAAAECGVNCVKFQKRDNKTLYTKAMYNKPYDNENSYGPTYGLHREHLEFGRDEYRALKKCAEEHKVEFMSTAFDFPSVEFLEDLGVTAYKLASGDVTNIPLLTRIAKLKKPMFVSTGAATMEEVRTAYDTILKHNDKLCLMQCTASYPTDYAYLNLRVIETYKKEFPRAVIGFSGHDNGILAGTLAYMLGATALEKHFTMNRAWKGTDHKFSLEPVGMRKQVRDLRRVDEAMGDGKKTFYDFERDARVKMGKGIYTSRALRAGTLLTEKDLCLKSPWNGLPPYRLPELLGRKLKTDLPEETAITLEHLE